MNTDIILISVDLLLHMAYHSLQTVVYSMFRQHYLYTGTGLNFYIIFTKVML